MRMKTKQVQLTREQKLAIPLYAGRKIPHMPIVLSWGMLAYAAMSNGDLVPKEDDWHSDRGSCIKYHEQLVAKGHVEYLGDGEDGEGRYLLLCTVTDKAADAIARWQAKQQ